MARSNIHALFQNEMELSEISLLFRVYFEKKTETMRKRLFENIFYFKDNVNSRIKMCCLVSSRNFTSIVMHISIEGQEIQM